MIVSDFSEQEREILNKIYSDYTNFGEPINITRHSDELGISKLKLIQISEQMEVKKLLKIYEPRGWDNDLDVSLTDDGFRVLGKSPIDWANDIKDLFIEKKENNYELIIQFYNNNEHFFIDQFEMEELLRIINNPTTSLREEIFDWLMLHRKQLHKIFNFKTTNNSKKLSHFIDLIRDECSI